LSQYFGFTGEHSPEDVPSKHVVVLTAKPVATGSAVNKLRTVTNISRRSNIP
jgi:hypothetical protein